jgi:hypothetical protein
LPSRCCRYRGAARGAITSPTGLGNNDFDLSIWEELDSDLQARVVLLGALWFGRSPHVPSTVMPVTRPLQLVFRARSGSGS